MFKPILFRDSIEIIPMLLRPASKGVVQLRSANPFEPPLLVPNYLTEDIDVKTMVEGTDVGHCELTVHGSSARVKTRDEFFSETLHF